MKRCNLCKNRIWITRFTVDNIHYHKGCLLDHIMMMYLVEHKIEWVEDNEINVKDELKKEIIDVSDYVTKGLKEPPKGTLPKGF